MPLEGFGAMMFDPNEAGRAEEVVYNAIRAGYRLIDTAASYMNIGSSRCKKQIGICFHSSRSSQEYRPGSTGFRGILESGVFVSSPKVQKMRQKMTTQSKKVFKSRNSAYTLRLICQYTALKSV